MFYNGQLLESETYIGGHVECLESDVFRSDLPTSFKLDPSAYGQLINNLDRDLQYAIKMEGKMDLETVLNYDEVKNAIMEKLIRLQDEPILEECPLIYHLDVAAMYPNIILTNRLQKELAQPTCECERRIGTQSGGMKSILPKLLSLPLDGTSFFDICKLSSIGSIGYLPTSSYFFMISSMWFPTLDCHYWLGADNRCFWQKISWLEKLNKLLNLQVT